MTISLMAIVCIVSLSWCLIFSKTMDQTLGMAYFGVTNALIGYLAGCLSKTTPTAIAPLEAKIVNTEKEPVNTTEVK